MMAGMAAASSSAFSATGPELVARREVGGYALEAIEYRGGRRLPEHAHLTPSVALQLTGEFTEEWRGGSRSFAPGSAIFRPPHDLHSDRYHLRTRIVAIGIRPEEAARLAACGLRLSEPREVRSAGIARLGFGIGRDLLSRDPAAGLCLEGAILEVLGSLFREPRGAPARPHVARARAFARENYRSRVSLGSLASGLGIHPVQLARDFRLVLGVSLGEYVRELRLDEACRRLASSSVSIAELAAELGFADHSHFNRVFRRAMGVAPGRFRRDVRGRG
jgi:AraC family transcriptional regulator